MDGALIINVLALILSGIFWTHLMKLSFIRMQWLELRLAPLIPRVLLGSFVCSLFIAISTTTVALLVDTKEWATFTPLNFILNILAVLVLILFWNSIYFTYHFFQKSRKQELDNLSLEASKNEVELKNLRSQLNPHFLFNALNSIRALIDIEPTKAKESVTTLSHLLRHSLLLGKENLVPLSDELNMVQHYLDLEKIRFEERLQIKWNVDPNLMKIMIPPFTLQMLVENAIKHGISHLVDGGSIEISAKNNDGNVVVAVENTGNLKSVSDTGIGIENTKRRLALQFRGTANFAIYQNENKVVAEIHFKNKI